MKGEDTGDFEKNDLISLRLSWVRERLEGQFGGSGSKVGFEYTLKAGPVVFAHCWVCGLKSEEENWKDKDSIYGMQGNSVVCVCVVGVVRVGRVQSWGMW